MKTTRIILLTCIVVAVSAGTKPVHAALMSFAQTVVADGAVAYWQLNDASTANGATAVSTVNPGTYNGVYQSGNQPGDGVAQGPAPYAVMGTAAYFHNLPTNLTLASSDAVIAPATGLPAGNSDRTMIFWERDSVTTQVGYYQIQAAYGTPGSPLFRDFIPTIYPGTSGQGLTNYGSTLHSDTPAINDGNWHFIAITAVDQGGGLTKYSAYVDGNITPVATDTNEPQNTVLNEMTIGSGLVVDLNAGGAPGWNGGLSNLAMFNYALSPTQIAILFASAPVPEPSTWVLLTTAVGTLFVGAVRRRFA